MAYLHINSPKSPRSYLVNKRIWYNKFFMNQKHVYNINHNLEPNPSSISTKPCKRKPVNFFWQVGPRQHRDSGTHWPPTVFLHGTGGTPEPFRNLYMGCYVSSYVSSYVSFSCLFQGGIPLNRSEPFWNRSETFTWIVTWVLTWVLTWILT